MEPEVREGPVEFALAGVSWRHDPAKTFGEEIVAMLGPVWAALRRPGVRHNGISRVVYEPGCTVFAGVSAEGEAGLERKVVRLGRHAYWKHVGPYRLLGKVGEEMRARLAARGVVLGWPMVEVYGHWTPDEARLETEVLVAVTQ